MHVLIVESRSEMATLWQRHLERHGHVVDVVPNGDAAVTKLTLHAYEVVILDVVLGGEPGLSVADYARYRRPEAQVIFVSDSEFFSDGSIFNLMPNARAFLPTGTPPEDMTALVEHYGRAV